jgi:hypothetical protein
MAKADVAAPARIIVAKRICFSIFIFDFLKHFMSGGFAIQFAFTILNLTSPTGQNIWPLRLPV